MKKFLTIFLSLAVLVFGAAFITSCDAVVVDDSESGIIATGFDSSDEPASSVDSGETSESEDSGEIEVYYIVSFDLDGGVGNIPSQSVENLKKAQEPSVIPTKEGYIFLGWYLGTERWIFSSYLITEDTCLKAKWQEVEQEPDKYTVSFDSDGGSFVLAKQLAVGEAYSFTAPVREN